MKIKVFQTTTDYHLALLELMSSIGSASTDEVIKSFGKKYQSMIPEKHYDKNNSGKVRWEWAVRWARQDLYKAGLMGSQGYGIWTITSKGRDWLRNNINADPKDLFDFARSFVNKQNATRLKPGIMNKDNATQVGVIGEDRLAHNAPRNSKGNTSRSRIEIAQPTKIMERELRLINEYLNGRNSTQISDEKLCDWVLFCYTLELFAEGKELFALVDSHQVNPWYYERTKKIAKLCSLREEIIRF